MEIDDKIYQEAIEVLRIKLRNTSTEMAFVENHSHQPEWYLHGMMRGLEIGYTIIKDLQNNKIYPRFKEKERSTNYLLPYIPFHNHNSYTLLYPFL